MFGISSLPVPDCNTVIATGSFDGVHTGHRHILDLAIHYAGENHCQSAAFTFWPHPKAVLSPSLDIKLLNTLEEKKRMLKACGIDHVIVCPFTNELSRMSKEDFVRDVLVNRLKMKALVMGENHHMGNPSVSSEISFESLSEKYGFDLISTPLLGGKTISSSSVRQALMDGDVDEAGRLLGYSYFVTGTVRQGDHIGHGLGFPTANLQGIDPCKILPKNGAYAVRVRIGDEMFDGMMNLGNRPTIGQQLRFSAEVNIFGFEGDLYEKTLTVCFIHRLRDEIRFSSVEELRRQLSKDREMAISLLN